MTDLLRWRCAAGHVWSSTAKSVRTRGTWCPRCKAPRRTLAEVQAFAAAFGGECLSQEFQGMAEPHRFRCRLGHEFDVVPTQVQQGHWCTRCRKAPRIDLDRLRLAAARRGGELLETEFRGPLERVLLRCHAGHEWRTTTKLLLAGKWCPRCFDAVRSETNRLRLSIADMQATAAERGGECVSEVYVNTSTKLRWRCHAGHEWDALPCSIRQGSWCPRCSNRRAGSLDAMRALAAEHGGACLSREYLNQRDRLEFRCARGHRFSVTGMAAKSGVWCPSCDPSHARAATAAPVPTVRRRRGPAA